MHPSPVTSDAGLFLSVLGSALFPGAPALGAAS